MSTDVIGRRRAVEERLARARSLAQTLDEATANLAASASQTIDDLDPDGSLRTALSALAGVAALRPAFDVIVALPRAAFALRVQHVENDVEIEVLQRDGPDELPEPAAAVPGSAGADSPNQDDIGPETPGPKTPGPEALSPETPGAETSGPESSDPENPGSKTARPESPGPEIPSQHRSVQNSPGEKQPDADTPEQNPPASTDVASDLAAMLWQHVDQPSA